jgi:energy-coupling factor transport system permease protein
MISQGLYLPGKSLLHRLHPLTKLVLTLAVLAAVFGGPGRWVPAVLPGLFALFLLVNSGLGGKAARVLFRVLPLTVILFLVHGLFSPQNLTSLARIGPFSIGLEGLLFALLITVRLLSALAASLLLILTTRPSDLVQALEEAGLPPGFAYLLGSPLLLLPQLAGRIQSIQFAQQARGLETQGSFLRRTRALYPLAGPLIFSSLVDVEDRSLALEVRGFSALNRKVFLKSLNDSPVQLALRRMMIILSMVLVTAGIWWRIRGGD